MLAFNHFVLKAGYIDLEFKMTQSVGKISLYFY
jgi:hypothetical protein